MAKKSGLGRGLTSLIPESEEEISQEKKLNVNTIDINLIRPNEQQPRKSFDMDKIAELANSIKEHGIIQPLILKKEENEIYSIIAGERRWRAAKSLALKEVPAVVMELDDKELLEVSLIENIQREDLNPIEEAIAFKRLINEFKLTQEELSNRISKSRTAITNTMRLLNLDIRVQEYIIDGVISEGHGRAILSINDSEKQYNVAQMIIDNGISVRETEKLIKKIQLEKVETDYAEKKLENTYEKFYLDIQKNLESSLGTKVIIKNKKNNNGKIEIDYFDSEDLERIIGLLTV